MNYSGEPAEDKEYIREPGAYDYKVVAAEERIGKESGNPYLYLEIKCVSNDRKLTKDIKYVNFFPGGGENKRKEFNSFLVTLGVVKDGKPFMNNEADLVNKYGIVVLDNKVWVNQDGEEKNVLEPISYYNAWYNSKRQSATEIQDKKPASKINKYLPDVAAKPKPVIEAEVSVQGTTEAETQDLPF